MHHTFSCAGQSQIFLSSCDSHIAETSFFFQFCRIVGCDRHVAWEQTIFHSCQIYMWEFQTFRTVQCHQYYIIRTFVQTVDICHQRYIFKETAECRCLILCLTVFFVSCNLVTELVYVFDS